jgi:hypothetical protein
MEERKADSVSCEICCELHSGRCAVASGAVMMIALHALTSACSITGDLSDCLLHGMRDRDHNDRNELSQFHPLANYKAR